LGENKCRKEALLFLKTGAGKYFEAGVKVKRFLQLGPGVFIFFLCGLRALCGDS
jgi:hypothetical protein